LESFDRAIAADPTMSIAHFNRVRALASPPGEGEAAGIEAALVASGDRSSFERSWLHFALGSVLEAEGRFADAFANYHQANGLRRGSIEYDEV
jgi:hypothetical protein